MNRIEFGDNREILRRWAAEGVRVQTCVTSPPYFGLRDYGVAGQLGLEPTPDEYIAAMVEVFRAVRDVLADDGTLWLNIGDSYASKAGGYDAAGSPGASSMRPISAGTKAAVVKGRTRRPPPGIHTKELIGIPWMLAFALRADGWRIRQDIIWNKSNPMPESVRDRCTKSHEYVFLLTKQGRYFFDQSAIEEKAVGSEKDLARAKITGRGAQAGSNASTGAPQQDKSGGFPTRSRRNSFARETKQTAGEHGQKPQHRPGRDVVEYANDTRNRRSVWTVPTRPYKGAHFATFPPALIEPCVLAGSRPGDIVLDPFMGSGTTAAVALLHGRQYLGCELNPEYHALQCERIAAAGKPAAAPRKSRAPAAAPAPDQPVDQVATRAQLEFFPETP